MSDPDHRVRPWGVAGWGLYQAADPSPYVRVELDPVTQTAARVRGRRQRGGDEPQPGGEAADPDIRRRRWRCLITSARWAWCLTPGSSSGR
jgi:hypothetical protein